MRTRGGAGGETGESHTRQWGDDGKGGKGGRHSPSAIDYIGQAFRHLRIDFTALSLAKLYESKEEENIVEYNGIRCVEFFVLARRGPGAPVHAPDWNALIERENSWIMSADSGSQGREMTWEEVCADLSDVEYVGCKSGRGPPNKENGERYVNYERDTCGELLIHHNTSRAQRAEKRRYRRQTTSE